MNDETNPVPAGAAAADAAGSAGAPHDASWIRRDLMERSAKLFAGKQLREAAAILETDIPKWDSAEAPDAGELNVVVALGILLATFNRVEEALALMESVAPFARSHSRALEVLGALRVKVDRAAEGKADLLRARELGPSRPSLTMALAEAALKTGDPELARRQTRDYVNGAPVYLSPAAKSQVTLLAVPRRAGMIRQLESPDRLHFPGGFVSQLFQRQPDVYRFLSVFVDSRNAMKAIAAAPKPDLVFNAHAHPERPPTGEGAERLSSLIGVFGVPTINHPDRIRSAATATPGTRYAGLPGVIVPETRQYERGTDISGLAHRIETDMGFPLVVRPPARRSAARSFLVSSRPELEAALLALRMPTIQASRFHESRHRDGLSRKIRAAMIGETTQIVRVDYDGNWAVRPRETIERARYYLDNPALLEEERRICRDPEATLGKEAMDRLNAMRERIPLDVFGIDFDVTEDGEILFFEASASMNLLNPGVHEAIDHPREAEDRVLTAFRELTDKLKAGPDS